MPLLATSSVTVPYTKNFDACSTSCKGGQTTNPVHTTIIIHHHQFTKKHCEKKINTPKITKLWWTACKQQLCKLYELSVLLYKCKIWMNTKSEAQYFDTWTQEDPAYSLLKPSQQLGDQQNSINASLCHSPKMQTELFRQVTWSCTMQWKTPERLEKTMQQI